MKALPIAIVALALPALGCSDQADPIGKGNMRFNVGFTDTYFTLTHAAIAAKSGRCAAPWRCCCLPDC